MTRSIRIGTRMSALALTQSGHVAASLRDRGVSVELVPMLTPGDFAVVKRKAGVMDSLDDPKALVAMLDQESKAKPDRPKEIGF